MTSILQTLLVFIIGSIGVAESYLPSSRQSTSTEPQQLTVESTAKKTNTVNYKGISFSFDPSLAAEVKSETKEKLIPL